MFVTSFLFATLISTKYDPAENKYRQKIAIIEHFAKAALLESKDGQIYVAHYGFEQVSKSVYNFVLLDREQKVVYKVYYDATKRVHKSGEDFVKHIKCDALCKTYDVKDVEINIAKNKRQYFLKVVASEKLDYTLNYLSMIRHYHTYEAMRDVNKRKESQRKKVNEIRKVIRAVTTAVKALHDNNIVHLDIKPQNIMFNTQGDDVTYKLIDFGGAQKLYDKQYGDICYTPGYQSIDFTGFYCDLSLSDDIWSIGMTAYTLYTGIEYSTGGPRNKPGTYSYFVLNMHRTINEKIEDTEFRDFLRYCLVFNKRFRPNASELLAHPFLRV